MPTLTSRWGMLTSSIKRLYNIGTYHIVLVVFLPPPPFFVVVVVEHIWRGGIDEYIFFFVPLFLVMQEE